MDRRRGHRRRAALLRARPRRLADHDPGEPAARAGWSVQLAGYTAAGLASGGAAETAAPARTLPLEPGNRLSLDGAELGRPLGGVEAADVVVLLVMQDDPTETVTQYARYALSVNGVTQPGG